MRVAAACLATALVLAAALPARADFGGVPDRVQISIGGTAAELVTQGTLTSEDVGAGAAIDFESLFNIPGSKSAGRIDGYWHFGDRHYLDFGYVQFDRSGSREIIENVDWGDFTFQAGAVVTATFDSKFPYAAYRYDFLHEDRVRISGSAGISYMEIAPSLSATGSVTGPSGPISGTVTEGTSVQFPVPLIGIRLDWVLRDRLSVETFSRLFRLKTGTFDGGMREATVRLKWHFTKHVGASVGIDSTTVRIKDYQKDDANLKFVYDISGASAYVTMAF